MLRHATLVLCVWTLALSGVGMASSAPYVFIPLSSAVSDTRSYGYAVSLVNGVPEAAGKCGSSTSILQGTPTIWNNPGSGTNILGDIPSATTAGVWAIDGNGDAAGVANISGNRTAFYLTAGGTSAAVLPYLNSGDAYGIACGVNTRKWWGCLPPRSTPPRRAFGRRATGVWGGTALPSLTNAASPYSQADAISNNGVVVGWGYTCASGGNYNLDAVSWSYNTSNRTWIPTDLSLSDRATYTLGFQEATAVNGAGTNIVGWGQLGGIEPNGQHAVAWINGTFTDLGVLDSSTGGTSYDQANGVNDSGVIVGGSDGHAFIWDSVNHMQDMNTVFASIIPANWTLLDADAIDNNGDIVGYGSNNGTYQGFLLTPALPGDANLDGMVDINDLTIVLSHYGQTGQAWANGNFTGDGTVNINDLTIVLAHYGDTVASSAAGNPSAGRSRRASCCSCAADWPLWRRPCATQEWLAPIETRRSVKTRSVSKESTLRPSLTLRVAILPPRGVSAVRG